MISQRVEYFGPGDCRTDNLLGQRMPLPAGGPGIITSFVVPILLWCFFYSRRRNIRAYNLDPQGRPGAFEPLLQKYLHLAEFTIGLATGSIVLIVGASFLHGKEGHLPWFYASPLLTLAGSVLAGIVFMAFLILNYEEVQHGNPHTPVAYAATETAGFTSLLLFIVGYVWLIVAVTT
jgi:hypothetical protein